GDLVGYEMVLVTGERVGPILEVWALPANDVLKVDHNGKEALIPLIDQVVKSIDHQSRTVVIVPMEGLLE
ncbi:MAG: ribosome maturation factor RimM, partial [Candidatus Marinimicrobia bacterium]|nr:ribosome maturation factor RimM [Candidatus Neomarinimicrobiota bacterium]